MGQIIASTYEIVENIGSGGGGVVYRARHLRLGKWVVLKADRRALSAKPEKLRREVDALKNLSHTYIPQVYDFFVENNTVYTVMDYIEGESLDKPLQRGESFSQAQVIEWACQLLEAVRYLHSRPPHGILHSDIKPSNIMRTPQGDIRLIDFNIALALGEDGAVRAGYSRGYASPEHYGATEFPEEQTQRETELMAEQKTVVETEQFQTVLMRQPEHFSSSTASRSVTLDVRSDIYSIGATLYHLLTGRKPARAAKDVLPILPDEASASVAAIITKAMSVAPDDRYQTAEEMLYAFEHLHENDLRTKRHKRRCAVTAAVLTALFLAGGVTTFVGLKQMERTQNAYVMAEYSVNALEDGDVERAVSYAMSALPMNSGIFDAQPIPEAQRALTNALGVYDLADGFKKERTIELTEEPLKIVLSPEGSRLAVLTTGLVSVFDVQTGQCQAELPAYPSVYSDMIFGGEDRLYFAGASGVTAYDLATGQNLWQGEPATALSLSGDGAILAAVFEDENQAMIYDAHTGERQQMVPFRGKYQRTIANNVFADTESNLFVLDRTGRYLAVSFYDGSLQVFDLKSSGEDVTVLESSPYLHFEGGFNGQYFAFSATGSEESLFIVIDMATTQQTGGFASEQTFHVKTDENGIYLNMQNILVQIDPVTGEQKELVYTDNIIDAFAHAGDYTLTATNNNGYTFFDANGRTMEDYDAPAVADLVQIAGEYAAVANRSEAAVRILKLETNPQAQMFTYDPGFAHYEARLGADRTTAMLYQYDSFRVFGVDGTVIADVQLPDAADVYDQQYRRGQQGDYLEVIYKDGLIRWYSAADGSVIKEEQGERPDSSLEEEFFTDRYHVVAPVHGAPSVYDKESGELVAQLETDDYLTYVTQVGEYIVTEYANALGERYGLLLDGELNILADLPGLCDILPDGTLVFDDMRGNLRGSAVYSLARLQQLALERMG